MGLLDNSIRPAYPLPFALMNRPPAMTGGGMGMQMMGPPQLPQMQPQGQGGLLGGMGGLSTMGLLQNLMSKTNGGYSPWQSMGLSQYFPSLLSQYSGAIGPGLPGMPGG